MIHICFALYDKTGLYSKFTGTTMLSIFENTDSEVTVHILHNNTLSQDNRDKFIYLAGKYSQTVKFYNVEILCADKINELKQSSMKRSFERYSIGTIFRFLIPHVIPNEIKKCIYLDSDIIVNLDVYELWKYKLADKIFAVVPEVKNHVPTNPLHYICRENFVKAEDYFNAGVLLINLEKFRMEEEHIQRGLDFYGKHQKCDCPDQDVLNYCFSTQTIKLPMNFNVLVEFARTNNDFETTNRICHYITSSPGKGILLNMSDPYNRLWMKYFMKTPWFDLEAIGRLYAGIQNLHVSLKNSMVQISAIMSGKSRAFFVAPNNLDAIKKIFSIRGDEEIILAENNESLKILIDTMNAERGKKVFFIMLPNFLFQILIQAGFVYGKDFIGVFEVLSEAQGVPLNSYQLIKAM